MQAAGFAQISAGDLEVSDARLPEIGFARGRVEHD
jgi:hypothetical protein